MEDGVELLQALNYLNQNEVYSLSSFPPPNHEGPVKGTHWILLIFKSSA